MVHLLRNSLDHGIEKPEVRLEQAKAAEGTIFLKSKIIRGKVEIECRDDGAGLNLGYLKTKGSVVASSKRLPVIWKWQR